MQASHKVHPAGPVRKPPPYPLAFLARSPLAQTSSSPNESSNPREQQRKWRKTLYQRPGVAMEYIMSISRLSRSVFEQIKPDTSMKRLKHHLKSIHCLIPFFMIVTGGPLYLIFPRRQRRDVYSTKMSSKRSETLATSVALSTTSCSPTNFISSTIADQSHAFCCITAIPNIDASYHTLILLRVPAPGQTTHARIHGRGYASQDPGCKK